MLIVWNTATKMKTDKSLCNLECPNCHSLTGHHLARKVSTTRLYYVLPIFWYTQGRYIACDVCNCGTSITKKEFNQLRSLPFQEDLIPATREVMMAHGYRENGFLTSAEGAGFQDTTFDSAAFNDDTTFNVSSTGSVVEPGTVPTKSVLKTVWLVFTILFGSLSILWTLLVASVMDKGDPIGALLILILPGYLVTGIFFALYKHKSKKN